MASADPEAATCQTSDHLGTRSVRVSGSEGSVRGLGLEGSTRFRVYKQQFDNHQPQEIPEVIPFFDSEIKNELYKMMEDFTERMNQELHKQEVLLAAQREQELLAQKQAAQEKQVPAPNSVFRQLIEEMCGTKVCEDQKQNMEDTMLDLLEICRQKELYCIHNNVDDLIESALNSKLLLINLNS
ncbi:hypothetical protein Tco_1531059 [Tanacetum coccineum]